MKVQIGKDYEVDVPSFVATRGLICANSGGGKSQTVRKFLEEFQQKGVMSIVLDIEGEFKTLREKFDFLLIGEGGDVPLSIEAADLLPRKLLELGVSTIIDISDLKENERIKYVKKFLEALMQLPRELWKPCIIILDEAHKLAGQQEKQDSTYAVIDLMTRGRKRGFCGILCTQRIAKLHKDAVAECNNVMIGRTGLDVDMKRASDILGFTTKADMLSLRDLEPGEFFVFGPAVSKSVRKIRVGQVMTTHPKVGMDLKHNIVPPTDRIKAMLTQLSDLPKEVATELKDKASLQKRVGELQAELARVKTGRVDKEELVNKAKEAWNSGYDFGLKEGTQNANKYWMEASGKTVLEMKAVLKSYDSLCKDVQKIAHETSARLVTDVVQKIQQHVDDYENRKHLFEMRIDNVPETRKMTQMPMITPSPPVYSGEIPEQKRFPLPPHVKMLDDKDWVKPEQLFETGEVKFGGTEKKILKFLNSQPDDAFTKYQIATFVDYATTSKSFTNAMSKLNSNKLIKKDGERICINKENFEVVKILGTDANAPAPTLDEWKSKLSGVERDLLQILLANPMQLFTKDYLADRVGYAATSKSFTNSLSKICSLELAEREDGKIKLNEEVLKWV